MPTLLITGANRGLGLGLAGACLADGWKVIALNRQHSDGLRALACDDLDVLTCDLTDDGELAGVADRLSGRTIDVLVNNAGRMAKRSSAPGGESVQGFGHFDRGLWRAVFDINLFTPMRLCELLVENVARAENGRMVTISSMLGSMALNESGGIYAYRASKAGVNAIMKSMSIDLRDRGITAVALHPGWVRTDMGGRGADLDIETSVAGMKKVIDGLDARDSGRLLSWDGTEMPW
jgi:NAD(P)-dependent dehydrogenase (short-subunit alcohol dehydrogenase family)